MWKAVRDLLPHSQLIGCQFHFSQALYRKIVEVGLGQTYRERGDKYLYLRKVMALPFLPADHIEDAFENLMEQAEELGNDQVLSFMAYVKRTWIDSQVWPPINWSVFDETTRTNNDVEGWHHRMNLKINSIDDRQEEQVQENTRQAVQAVGGLRGRHHRHRPPTQARGPPGRI